MGDLRREELARGGPAAARRERANTCRVLLVGVAGRGRRRCTPRGGCWRALPAWCVMSARPWPCGLAAGVLASCSGAGPRRAQEPPVRRIRPTSSTPSWAGLLGFKEITRPGAAGGGRGGGRGDVPLAGAPRLPDPGRPGPYLKEVLDDEYPPARAPGGPAHARSPRTCCRRGTDLRAVRARVLEENIAGFYDERPGQEAPLRRERGPHAHPGQPARALPRAAPRPAGPVRRTCTACCPTRWGTSTTGGWPS